MEKGTRKGISEGMTDPEGNLIEYTYDNAKRLKTVKKGGTLEASYDYNALGLRTKLTYGNTSYAEYTYDGTTRWLKEVYNKKFDATVISSFVYTHDKVGNRTKMTLASGDYIDYTYDKIYQLTDEVRTGGTAYNISWTYDEVGNRLSQTKDGVTTDYTYNDANQLTSETTSGVITNYAYDANGNQTTKTQGGSTWTWSYDYENRQTGYSGPGVSASYIYDAEGKRIRKTVGASVEKFFYDGANVVADYDGSNNLKATYITPFLDQNLIKTIGTNKYCYMQDGLGSVRNILDSTQAVKNSYDHYAFGEDLGIPTENIPNRYKFTSREWDAESQTYYYRARYYNPSFGRFQQREPMPMGYTIFFINLYSYVRNNPINRSDPRGLQADITIPIGPPGGGAPVYISPILEPEPTISVVIPPGVTPPHLDLPEPGKTYIRAPTPPLPPPACTRKFDKAAYWLCIMEQSQSAPGVAWAASCAVCIKVPHLYAKIVTCPLCFALIPAAVHEKCKKKATTYCGQKLY